MGAHAAARERVLVRGGGGSRAARMGVWRAGVQLENHHLNVDIHHHHTMSEDFAHACYDYELHLVYY